MSIREIRVKVFRMTLSEMREVLASRGIQLTKSLGQNFLHDANQLRRIVEVAELTKSDKVLEIGPGLGPLTELILGQASEALAIEVDRRLVSFLRERFGEHKNLTIVEADALKFLREQRDWSSWKLVSNLPYSVASPIFVELAQNPRRPKRMVATLQLEVAQRLMASAGDEHYGVLSLLIQLRYEPHTFFKIPGSCFFPEPDVDSACVVLQRREQALLPEAKHRAFEKIVKRAFSQRRKMMLKLLKADWPAETLECGFWELTISPRERAEKVSLEQFVRLTEIMVDS